MSGDIEALILAKVVELAGVEFREIDLDASLFGENGVLDSLQVVSLCIELEDRAEEEGFEFDWTSETALSRSRSFFRSARSLAEEYRSQQGSACRS